MNIRHAAVAIAVVRQGQFHVGVLHKSDDLNEVKFGHLAWHNQLRTSTPKESYLWIDPGIPEPRARQVAARCRHILRANNRGIPYAFSPPNDCFDLETGSFLLGPNRVGLTCATFVLAVFDAAGIRLADYGSWPNQRAGDVEWQAYVIEQLLQSGAGKDHVELVRNQVGGVRFRPEDVAACAASDELPCSFQSAISLAPEILNQLNMHGNAHGA